MRPILLLLACAAVMGCGSDDGELSVEGYRERANELCAEAADRIEQIDFPRSQEEVADYLAEGLELSIEYDRRISELDPPDQLEGLHEKGVRLATELERALARMIDRVRTAASPQAVLRRELERLVPKIERADEINRELKLDECLENSLGEGPTPPT